MPEQYADSPLRAVTLEVRFPGRLVIESLGAQMQESLREEFPELHVPVLQHGKAPMLEPVHLRAPDSEETFGFAINRVFYISNRYGGFERFSGRACQLVSEAANRFGVEELTRVGLRYVNEIAFVREEGLIPMDQFLNLRVTGPGQFSGRPEQINLSAVTRVPPGMLKWTVQNRKVASVEGAPEILVVDFDFYLQGNELRAERLAQYVADAHRETKRVFEGLITEDFRAAMRGAE